MSYNFDKIIEKAALSVVKDYQIMKELGLWDYHLSGLAFGIFISTNQEIDLEVIAKRIEDRVHQLLN